MICDYTGNGIKLDGTEDRGFTATVRGTLEDSTTGESGTYSGWRNTNYPVKIVVDANGDTIQLNGSNVMFFPSSVVAANCSLSVAYDCINYKCEPATKYNTPGHYSSLQDCEAVCGNGVCASGKQCLDPANYCPPGKVCLEDSEVSKMSNLIKLIKNKVC